MTDRYPAALTVTCRHHCGPVATTDRAFIRATWDTVVGLVQGHAPLGAMTCPRCHEEVRASDIVSHHAETWLAKGTR